MKTITEWKRMKKDDLIKYILELQENKKETLYNPNRKNILVTKSYDGKTEFKLKVEENDYIIVTSEEVTGSGYKRSGTLSIIVEGFIQDLFPEYICDKILQNGFNHKLFDIILG